MKTHDAIKRVCDADSFLHLLKLMHGEAQQLQPVHSADDAEQPHSAGDAVEEEWQNDEIATFLDAMIGWIEDRRESNPELFAAQPTWELVAKIVHAGKIYE